MNQSKLYSDIIEKHFVNFFVIVIAMFVLTIGIQNNVGAEKNEYFIPTWVRTIAEWWGEDKIQDQDFVNSLQYLIENDLLIIPESKIEPECGPGLSLNTQTNECEIHDESETKGIFPEAVNEHQKIVLTWIKTTSFWWGQGKLSDQDFTNVLQYLVENNVIVKEPIKQIQFESKQEFQPQDLIVWPKINKIEDFKIQGHGNTETYYLQFRLLDDKLKAVSADGTISIVIMDDRNRILYVDAFSIRKSNYVESVDPFVVEHNDKGEKLFAWNIKTSDIQKGFTPYGSAKLVFTDRFGNNFESETIQVSIPQFS